MFDTPSLFTAKRLQHSTIPHDISRLNLLTAGTNGDRLRAGAGKPAGHRRAGDCHLNAGLGWPIGPLANDHSQRRLGGGEQSHTDQARGYRYAGPAAGCPTLSNSDATPANGDQATCYNDGFAADRYSSIIRRLADAAGADEG